MLCRVCSAQAVPFSRAQILKRHEIGYFRCPTCGVIQTEDPFWLEEAYEDAIARADVGLVQRNLRRAPIVAAVIGAFFRPDRKFIDYGGGYGLLVRLMRDAGYDFYRSDLHCANLLAQDFEADPQGDGSYELLTAMELFEHLVDPVGEVGRMLSYSRSIFFTTQILPEPAPRPEEWWYYALDQGQHVTLYTRKALEILARRFGLHLVTDGVSRHLLTERRISSPLFNAVSKYKCAQLLAPFFRRQSLIPADYRQVTGNPLAGGDL